MPSKNKETILLSHTHYKISEHHGSGESKRFQREKNKLPTRKENPTGIIFQIQIPQMPKYSGIEC